jgi:hypothetical protein
MRRMPQCITRDLSFVFSPVRVVFRLFFLINDQLFSFSIVSNQGTKPISPDIDRGMIY